MSHYDTGRWKGIIESIVLKLKECHEYSIHEDNAHKIDEHCIAELLVD
jgi:hypothetical protein